PRRRPDLGNHLAARFALREVALIEQRDHPHRCRGGVPARSAERAEMRVLGRLFINMKRLRVVLLRKCLDALGGERVVAEHHALANLEVLEIVHARATSATAATSRRSSICVQRSVNTQVPAWLNTSYSMLIKPSSGRLRDARVANTVPRAASSSPGRTGAS